MLWVLAAGYAWIVLGFAVKGLAGWLPIPESLALHTFAVGGIGGLIYGMMPRISLGHTGRKIAAGPMLVAGFALMNLSAFLRVVTAGLFPNQYLDVVVGAGIAWVVAFALFVGGFWRILSSPRADGKPG